jgi:hypothetical protein
MTRIAGDLQQIRGLMPQSMIDAYRELRRAMEVDSSFDVRLRELVRLKSAELSGCVH